MRATKLAFEQRYSDDSGVEFAVRLDEDEIEFEAINKISFPVGELDWLLGALMRIKSEVSTPPLPDNAELSTPQGVARTPG